MPIHSFDISSYSDAVIGIVCIALCHIVSIVSRLLDLHESNQICTLVLLSKTNAFLCRTDALTLPGRGLDAVVIGYGGKGAHSVDEHILISDLEKATEILKHMIGLSANA